MILSLKTNKSFKWSIFSYRFGKKKVQIISHFLWIDLSIDHCIMKVSLWPINGSFNDSWATISFNFMNFLLQLVYWFISIYLVLRTSCWLWSWTCYWLLFNFLMMMSIGHAHIRKQKIINKEKIVLISWETLKVKS